MRTLEQRADAVVSTLASAVVGSLTAGTYGFGMTDGKAFQTVYVRLADGANPNSKADGFVYCIN